MKKGQTMPVESRKKISETKQERAQRERIGCQVIRLLLLNKVKEAKTLARRHASLFFIG